MENIFLKSLLLGIQSNIQSFYGLRGDLQVLCGSGNAALVICQVVVKRRREEPRARFPVVLQEHTDCKTKSSETTKRRGECGRPDPCTSPFCRTHLELIFYYLTVHCFYTESLPNREHRVDDVEPKKQFVARACH